jgi:hypothetical protein
MNLQAVGLQSHVIPNRPTGKWFELILVDEKGELHRAIFEAKAIYEEGIVKMFQQRLKAVPLTINPETTLEASGE